MADKDDKAALVPSSHGPPAVSENVSLQTVLDRLVASALRADATVSLAALHMSPEAAGAMVKAAEESTKQAEIEKVKAVEVARSNERATIKQAEESTKQAASRAQEAESRAKEIEHRYATTAKEASNQSKELTLRNNDDNLHETRRFVATMYLLGSLCGPSLVAAFCMLKGWALAEAISAILALPGAVFSVDKYTSWKKREQNRKQLEPKGDSPDDAPSDEKPDRED